VYEPEAFKAFGKWLAETGNRELYVIGPLAPLEVRITDNSVPSVAESSELAISENGAEVQDFMNKIMSAHGKQSLIYVSCSPGSILMVRNFPSDLIRKHLVA
jgi:hypothetical protein